MLKATEIMNFIREACKEKREREYLCTGDRADIDCFLDHVENFANYVTECNK